MHVERHRDDYIETLRRLNGADSWNAWIAFFLHALSEQAEANATTARRIVDLYERLKGEVLDLTHSPYAVPLLDRLFVNPILNSRFLVGQPDMPSRQMVMLLLGKLREAGMLQVVMEARGQRPQVLALAELVNLCEGRQVI